MNIINTGITENDLLRELLTAARAEELPALDPARHVTAAQIAGELGWKKEKAEKWLRRKAEDGELKMVEVRLPNQHRGIAFERVK